MNRPDIVPINTRFTIVGLLLLAFTLFAHPAQAATKITALGITQEEINTWNTRRVSGPYRTSGDVSTNSPDDWTRIQANADSFLSSPTAEVWSGYTGAGCYDNNIASPQKPGQSRAEKLRDAAFVFLLTGNTTYRDAVLTQLLSQASQAGTQFGDGVKWISGPGCTIGDSFIHEIGGWLAKLTYAYDYIRHSNISAANKATLDAWFLAAGVFWDDVASDHVVNTRFPNRNSDNYTPYSSWNPIGADPQTPRVTHFGGYTVQGFMEEWSNRFANVIRASGLIGVLLNNSTLKASAKRWFQEYIKYHLWPDSTASDFRRWTDTLPTLGWHYSGSALGSLVSIADAFARAGDTSLYDYQTTEGLYGTSDGVTTKSLLKAILIHTRMVNGTVTRYGTSSSANNGNAAYRIGPNDGVSVHRKVHDTYFAQANLYYNNAEIKSYYTRQAAGSPAYPVTPQNSGEGSSWGGAWNALPGVLFMFGQMEGTLNPYLPGITYYVSTAGNNANSCTAAQNRNTPKQTIASAITCLGTGSLGAGSTIVLLDGVYAGTGQAIAPPAGVSGVAGSPITVRAENDGKVRINGEGVRNPVNLNGNSYWVVEGMNAHNSSGAVVVIQNNANNNIIRRVCAWDIPIGLNNSIYGIHGSTGNLLEDTCGFGTGRKIYETSQGGNNTVVRNSFGIGITSTNSAPKVIFEGGYNDNGVIFENSIGFWHHEGAVDLNEHYAIFNAAGTNDGIYYNANLKFLGGIGITRSAFNIHTGILAQAHGGRAIDGVLFKDLVLANDPGTHTFLKAQYMQLHDGGSGLSISCEPNCDRRVENVTEVGFGTPSVIQGENTTDGWDTSNIKSYANIANMQSANASPWQTTAGNGGRMCTQYQNGTLTSVPLWPWPMDQRIIDALVAAGKDPAFFFGAGNNLTQYLVSVFGPIPSPCSSVTNPQDLVLAMPLDSIAAGAIVSDVSGFANHGTVDAGTIAAGKFNNALSFTTPGRVTVADSTSLDLTTGFTLEAWVFPTDVTTSSTVWRTVLAKNASYHFFVASSLCGNGPRVSISAGGTSFGLCDPVPLTTNTWTHLAAIYDGTQLILYRNGLPSVSLPASGTLAQNANPLFLANTVNTTDALLGRLDEVRVYNYARTQAQIQSDMATGLAAVIGRFRLPALAAGLRLGADAAIIKMQGVP